MRLLLAVALVVIAAVWWLARGHQADGLPPGSAAATGAAAERAGEPHAQTASGGIVRVGADVAPQPGEPEPGDEMPAPAVGFLVLDGEQRPVVGARVIAFDGERELAQERSDRDGRARLRAVAAHVDFRIVARGYLTAVSRADPSRDEQVVVLAPAPQLRGRVTSGDGLPVAGARAVLLPAVAGRTAAPAVLAPDAATATSDERGEFVLPWPDLRLHDLIVTAAGFAPTVHAHLDARSSEQVVVMLRPSARLAGLVASATGSPLPDALVEVRSAALDRWPEVRTLGAPRPWLDGELLAVARADAQGRFACDDLPAGPAWAMIASLGDVGGERLELSAGRVTSVTLTAPAPGTITGRAAGVVAGAEVFLHAVATRLAAVDEHGAFRFEQVPPGRYLVGVRREPFARQLQAAVDRFAAVGHAPQVLVVDVGPGERRDLDLLPTASSIGGIGGDAFLGSAPATSCLVAVVELPAGSNRPAETGVRSDGSFRLFGLSPGDYRVRLLSADGAVLLAESPCRVLPGDTTLLSLRSP